MIPVQLVEFDFLITKAKVMAEEDFKDFLNPVSRAEVRETEYNPMWLHTQQTTDRGVR